jgi:protein-tyrosine phosphatase
MTMGIEAWPQMRVLPLEGGRNFRDLGGYETQDGRHVRWGLLFRSGSLMGLTATDWTNLTARGLRALCDLRTTRERESEPVALEKLPSVSYWSRDYTTSFADLRRLMATTLGTGDDARRAMMTGYRGLPFDQASAYRQLFGYLKGGHVPVIFNCSAGKDRTGTAAALVLLALGVPRATVLEDFVLTNEVLDLEGILVRRAGTSLMQQPREVIGAILRADPDYLLCALDSIDERHGDLAGFLREELAVSDQELQRLRDTLLE